MFYIYICPDVRGDHMYKLFAGYIQIHPNTTGQCPAVLVCGTCTVSLCYNINFNSTSFLDTDFVYMYKMMRLHFSRVVILVYYRLQISPTATSLKQGPSNLWPCTVDVAVLLAQCFSCSNVQVDFIAIVDTGL